MVAYQLVLVLKFMGILGYAGGVGAAFLSAEPEVRKRAVHRIASPSLLVIWLAGYTLLMIGGVSFVELWPTLGALLSVVANGILVFCVTRGLRSRAAFVGVAAPLACVILLMVFKPTWAGVLP